MEKRDFDVFGSDLGRPAHHRPVAHRVVDSRRIVAGPSIDQRGLSRRQRIHRIQQHRLVEWIVRIIAEKLARKKVAVLHIPATGQIPQAIP